MPTSQTEIPMKRAQRGETGYGVRYILVIGLALAVCAMILVPFVAH